MGRVNEDQWLDKALNQALRSEDTRPDFQKWVADHPEAIEKLTSRTPQRPCPPRIRRILMNTTIVRIAAAALIAVIALVGITQLSRPGTNQTVASGPSAGAPGATVIVPTDPPLPNQTLQGPMTHPFADGSSVKLAQGARIRTYTDTSKRGFEHLGGQIEVAVAKGRGEFIVTTPYGDVRALGTQFTMRIVDDATSDTKERVQLLAVAVKEGSVEVRNVQGAMTLRENQGAVVAVDTAPYDFSQDQKLPPRLRARVAAMLAALEAGDAAAWVANHNIDYMYRLVKGQEPYDPQRFGGTEADLERICKGFGDVAGPQELKQRFLSSGGIKGAGQLYVRAVALSADGKHAQAECVQYEGDNSLVVTTPQWHFFDNDWWQVDD